MTSQVAAKNLANNGVAAPCEAHLSFIMNTSESRKGFPLRTLMVCVTVWLVATEVLVYDLSKFDAKAQLLDEVTRGLRGADITAPGEQSSNLSGNETLPGDVTVERL